MNNNLDYIKKNIEILNKKIETAAKKSGRNEKEIKIIAVTKTVEKERIDIAIQAGLTNLGEGKVQELCKKYDNTNSSCNWHLIGHLQKNKVKYIFDKISMIHSIDNFEIANEIQKYAQKIDKKIEILLQVNISEELTKYGILSKDALNLLFEISNLKNLSVRGLMTIAPFTQEVEKVRQVFKTLRELSIDIKKENINNITMDFLSMGMSNDYETAIEEGANIIRIGTAIFGQR